MPRNFDFVHLAIVLIHGRVRVQVLMGTSGASKEKAQVTIFPYHSLFVWLKPIFPFQKALTLLLTILLFLVYPNLVLGSYKGA